MFGKDRLLREGAEAQALVLDKRVYAAGVQSNEATSCRYELRVKFQDGTTSEISRRVWHRRLAGFQIGDLVPVRYDPDDRSKVEIDEPKLVARDEAAEKAAREQAIERGEQALEGSGSGSQGDASESFREEAAAFREQAAEFREQAAHFAERSAEPGANMEALQAIMRAKAAGDEAEVERLKAELKRKTGES
ncbi:MAG: DUF3592 domain-containing protein [Thermoleophilaceae bacterium]